MSGLCYSNLQNYALAISNFKNCQLMRPGSDTVFMKIGECYLSTNIDSAKFYFNKIIERQPRNWMAFNFRGMCYLKERELDSAANDFNESINLSHNYLAYNNMGRVNEERGDFRKAISYYNLAIQKNQKDDKVFFNKGVSHMYLKQLDSAMINYNLAIKINPNNSLYFLNRGMVNYLLKSYDAACMDWKQSSKMNNASADSLMLQYCR